ncbi:uncharacterized protein LOC122259095 [Penaeus japonicus]|uniref:uncharacterized protein LOC122259095 n=1 Tax=Penaeus japonicus TaxID=27405 RepID=UPI001C70BDAB|nr:uncharacterized protein LOC122259095 [Penaeus japonicus]
MMQKHKYILTAIVTIIMVTSFLRVYLPRAVIKGEWSQLYGNRQPDFEAPPPLARQIKSPEKTDENEPRDQMVEVIIQGKSCNIRKPADPEEIYRYIAKTPLKCEMPVMVGGTARKAEPPILNEKWVCMDKRYNIKPWNCLVYSFGIDVDWSFDDDMDKRFNCKVYAFDHTIGKPDHNRSKNIQFYATGIAAQKKKNVDRYINLLKRFGHENTIIDYLKIDVEGAERQFFEDVLYQTPQVLKNIKQIGMEIHTGKNKKNMELYYKYAQLLECFGFKLIFQHILDVPFLLFKEKGELRSCCYELVWAQDKQW